MYGKDQYDGRDRMYRLGAIVIGLLLVGISLGACMLSFVVI